MYKRLLFVRSGAAANTGTAQHGRILSVDDSATENRLCLNQMRATWSLRKDDVFRHDAWESAKRNALKSLILERYPTAFIADSLASALQ